MPDQERDGADDSAPEITKGGKGVRDAGQAFDGGRQPEDLREFPGVSQEEPKDQ